MSTALAIVIVIAIIAFAFAVWMFVDEPRGSVEKADQLVASTIKRLAEVFANQKTRLEEEWAKADHVSTEDLRPSVTAKQSRCLIQSLGTYYVLTSEQVVAKQVDGQPRLFPTLLSKYRSFFDRLLAV